MESPSTLDLDRAIAELDGMYHDLRRRSQVEAQLGLANLSTFESDDDEDYDIPRPAGGFMNSDLRDESPLPFRTFKSPVEDDFALKSPQASRTTDSRQSCSNKSPTPSLRSEYSSGFGTLPYRGEPQISVPEIEFPAPPDFDPPPLPLVQLPPSDSDYDDVASESDSSEDTFVYRHPVNTPHNTTGKPVLYTQIPIRKPEHLSVDVIKVNKEENWDDPDYDEPFNPASKNECFSLQELDNDADEANIPMVVQMKRIDSNSSKHHHDNSPAHEHHQQGEEEYSFITPHVQIQQSKSLEHIEKVKSNDVIEKALPVDENGNVVETLRRHTSPAHSTLSVEDHKKPYLSNSPNPTVGGMMDAEAQRSPARKGEDCPCECGYAVPLMSVAVIICIMGLMFLAIGYVYIGIKNDEYLASVSDSLNTAINSGGSGSGDVL